VRVERVTSATDGAHSRPSNRAGYTLLEVQVAFAVLGIGLAGLCPFVVMQLRQVRQLELRLQGKVVQTGPRAGTNSTMLPGTTYYIVPWTNVWARKLTGSGQILTSIPTPPAAGPAPGSRSAYIEGVQWDPSSQTATVTVDVSPPS